MRRTTPLGQTFSAGVVEVSGRDPLEVMQSADSALYLAKESGRDRVVALDRAGRHRTIAGASS